MISFLPSRSNNLFNNRTHSFLRQLLSPHSRRPLSTSSPTTHPNLVSTPLKSRALLKLTGPDTLPFIQGLITNDVSHLENPEQKQNLIFAFLLNHQGRVLYEVLIYSCPEQDGSEQQHYIECEASVKSKLLKHLTLYRVKRKVVIKEAEVNPWVVFDPSVIAQQQHPYDPISLLAPNLKSVTEVELCETCRTGSATSDSTTTTPTLPKRTELKVNGQSGYSDPRLQLLGWRFILGKDESLDLKPAASELEYKKLLISLGVGEGVVDHPPGNCFPLEANGDYLHGVSFHKGCYVGQELTARTHHTGVVRKRLMPFRLPADKVIPPDVDPSKLEIKNQAGKSVGKVRNLLDSYGLALTRVDDALAATQLKLGEIPVTIQKPLWWPVELRKEAVTKSDNV